MNKWLFVLLGLGVIGGAWWGIRTYVRVTPPGDEPKLEKIVRGDLRVPITAPGLVEPKARLEIKPEASGEVLKVYVVEGMRVQPGEPLVNIKEDDERRNFEKAQANVQRANALLEQANIATKKAASNTQVAEARIRELESNATRLRIDLEKEESMGEMASSDRAKRTILTSIDMNKAQLDAAQAQAQIAKQSEGDAQQAVQLQKAVVSDANATLKDAETRLSRTKVVAKADMVITEVRVKEGMVVQSGTSGFSLGSTLLTLADVSKIKVVTRVDEADYGKIANVAPIPTLPDVNDLRQRMAEVSGGQSDRSGKVKVTVDAYPDLTFEGVIERVEPQGKLNPGSSVIQYDVHVEITDDKRSVLPLGAQAQVEFTVESVAGVLMVPADAVKQKEGEKGVYIRGGTSNDAKPRFVKARFGITDGANTHLIGTLSESEGDLLKEGVEVYTRLPVVREEERR